MPAKDFYHNTVRKALIKDGWNITHDPLKLEFGSKDMYVDLGAERLIAAERANEKIAVEIKSFLGRSEMDDLEEAVGQYILYHDVLAELEPQRVLFLAIPHKIFLDIFDEPLGQLLLKNNRARLVTFEPRMEEIVRWIT
jgi:hypothetical protein